MQKGYFYNKLTLARKDTDDLKSCIEETVANLTKLDTSSKKPGILLGKVQSGKTRAFLGVMALAFDNGYDIAIILTKGTKPLTEQTLKRLHEDFGVFEEENKVQIHDIMAFPKNMVPYELNQKLIIVAKKEINNLKHVINALTTTYPDLKNKKILIIDDEADFASISFHKEKETGIVDQGKIAKQIDEIRTRVEKSDFLQVTVDEVTPNEEANQNQAPTESISASPEAETPVSENQTAQMGVNEPLGSEPEPIVPTDTATLPQYEAAKPTNTETQTVPEPAPTAEAKLPQTQSIFSREGARAVIAKAQQAIQFGKRKKLDRVMSLFAKRTNITNDEVEKLLHVSDATATRYLSTLEKEGKIKQTGKTGKAVSYSKI